MRVLLAASEAMPYVKTGGLADVAGALPKALIKLGTEAAVMIPLHKSFKTKYYSELKLIAETYIDLGWRHLYLGILSHEYDGITYYFIDNEDYFGSTIYRGGDSEIEQYLYFCRAVLAAVDFIDFKPDIIHCNDWHTGMIPMLIKTQYKGKYQSRIKTVFTIHNIKFQGQTSFGLIADMLSIPKKYNTAEFIEAHGCANMMKAALVFADKITTVSPRFAEEIKSDYFGYGLEGILRARSRDFIGILNGIDYDDYNPELDPALPKNYTSASFVTGKRACRAALMSELGLDIPSDAPVFAAVSRLTEQKGIDLIAASIEEMLSLGAAFVLLGSGESKYENYFRFISSKYPEKTGIHIGYNEGLSRRVYAGSDFLLMPSLFEPCGISQLIAQRYGTLPIVRETGGLIDTVIPYNEFMGAGDGFSFSSYNAKEMMHVITLAMKTFSEKSAHKKLVRGAMKKNNSFDVSSGEYLKIYNSVLGV